MNNKPKILYVDDEEMNITVFRLTFSKVFEVLTAESGEKGMEIFTSDPDIKFIISDMRMPAMNGLEFIRKIRNVCAHVPCSILSGYQESPEILEALDNGEIVDYLLKPFNRGAIEQLVLKHVNGTTGN
ncbi:response regulator [Draconibacterium mangrovi]|uniref:response regulator n=1 Tax=Draconibacterium mangrovi TaxID=2697469 RepID=UPI0013D3FE08|nr:response regulator [Draconibacterium mangrovi]